MDRTDADHEGRILRAVMIPIEEWNELKTRFNIEEEDFEVPEWHKEIVCKRM